MPAAERANLPTLENPVTIAEIGLGKETLLVQLKTMHGRRIFAAWRFYADKFGQLQPARHGLMCSVEHLPAIAEAFASAVERARAEGLLPPSAK
jgi:hypothetical protein